MRRLALGVLVAAVLSPVALFSQALSNSPAGILHVAPQGTSTWPSWNAYYVANLSRGTGGVQIVPESSTDHMDNYFCDLSHASSSCALTIYMTTAATPDGSSVNPADMDVTITWYVHGIPFSSGTTYPFNFTLAQNDSDFSTLCNGMHDISISVADGAVGDRDDWRYFPMLVHYYVAGNPNGTCTTVPSLSRDVQYERYTYGGAARTALGSKVVYVSTALEPTEHPISSDVFEPFTELPWEADLYQEPMMPHTEQFIASPMWFETPSTSGQPGFKYLQTLAPKWDENHTGLRQTWIHERMPMRDGGRGVGWTSTYIQGFVREDNNCYVFIETGQGSLRQMCPDGTLTTIAGWVTDPAKYPIYMREDKARVRENQILRGDWSGCRWGGVGDGWWTPMDVAYIPSEPNTYYVAEGEGNRVCKVELGAGSGGQALITSFVGSTAAVAGYVNATGSAARLYFPTSIVGDPVCDCLYFVDRNDAIRKITKAGVVTTLVGRPEVDGDSTYKKIANGGTFPDGANVRVDENITHMYAVLPAAESTQTLSVVNGGSLANAHVFEVSYTYENSANSNYPKAESYEFTPTAPYYTYTRVTTASPNLTLRVGVVASAETFVDKINIYVRDVTAGETFRRYAGTRANTTGTVDITSNTWTVAPVAPTFVEHQHDTNRVSATEIKALEHPGGSGERKASIWYNATGFDVRMDFGSESHQVAFYGVDWDNSGRAQTISVLDDDTSSVLVAAQTMSSFQNGKYLRFNVTGDVKFRVTRTAGPNVAISGFFIDPGTAGNSFIGTDTTTQGDWIGVYGSEGYNVIGGTPYYPNYSIYDYQDAARVSINSNYLVSAIEAAAGERPDFHYPFCIRVASDGDIILSDVGYGAIRRVDVSTFETIQISRQVINYQTPGTFYVGWSWLDVDRWGNSGPLDGVYFGTFQGSHCLEDTENGVSIHPNEAYCWSPGDGSVEGKFIFNDSTSYPDSWGKINKTDPPHYFWVMQVIPAGGLYMTGGGEHGITRLRVRKETDLFLDNYAGTPNYENGKWRWISGGNDYTPSLQLTAGHECHNYIGAPDCWAIAGLELTDEEIIEMFNIPESEMTTDNLNDVLLYVRMNAGAVQEDSGEEEEDPLDVTVDVQPSRCTYTATGDPPDGTGGWTATFYRNGVPFMTPDAAAPYSRAGPLAADQSYSFTIRWTKEGENSQTTAALVVSECEEDDSTGNATLAVAVAVTRCMVSVAAVPPDFDGGWSAQMYRNGIKFGLKDTTATHYVRTEDLAEGVYSITVRWSKTGESDVTTTPVVGTCTGG